ncbi:histone-lysine N-methyltransferase SETD1A [Triticum aestivum]|uniref:histone-lysine N-methyltransferase SETD1A n=1 Tax=Triticum aestivum TaxID=4565 RepID=UPI001D016D7F|nr:histone-lysine N-methyltransferase SETD1A-like [Triticum aestivum]
MYSMPNGDQEQDLEGEASGGESGEWRSDDEEDEESDDLSDEEEVDSPPCREKRSKLSHDLASASGKATAQTGQSSKRPRTSSPASTEKASKQPKATPSKPPKALPKIKVAIPITSGAATFGTSTRQYEDEDMEDAVTSNLAPPNVIELPDDDEDVPLRPRKSKKTTAGRISRSEPATEPTVQRPEDASRASVTFVVPVSSDHPAPSTVPVFSSAIQPHALEPQAAVSGPSVPFFTTYHVPESQSDAAAEAIRQAGVMMERMKAVHDNSQAAYDASVALRANV